METLTVGLGNERSGTQEEHRGLMELVVERQNCFAALARVKANRAAPASMG